MANSIDFGTLAVGALVGIGCRKQLRAAGRVAANLASSLATTTAVAVNSAAAEFDRSNNSSNNNGGKKNDH